MSGLRVGARVTLVASGYGVDERLAGGWPGEVVSGPDGKGWWQVRLDAIDGKVMIRNARAKYLTVLE